MRVAINTSGAVAGGAITHLRNLLPHLARHFAAGELVVIGSAQTRESLGTDLDLDWHEVEPASNGLLGRLWFENAVLPKTLSELGADVLFHPANFCAFRVQIPQVILIHNLAPFLEEVVDGESLLQKARLALLGRLTRSSITRAARTIFISGWGRELVLRQDSADESKTPIIPFGSEHGSKGNDPTILGRLGLRADGFALTVSHIYRYKKLEKLLEAWVFLDEVKREIPLVVVGEPFDREYMARLRAMVAEARLPVMFTGALGPHELTTLMRECRVFLFSSEAENLPITLLEAMSAGCAIVTNRACSMPEVCKNAAIYADPATPDRYAREIGRVLDDTGLRADLSKRARARSKAFSWARTAAQTAALLRSATSDG